MTTITINSLSCTFFMGSLYNGSPRASPQKEISRIEIKFTSYMYLAKHCFCPSLRTGLAFFKILKSKLFNSSH